MIIIWSLCSANFAGIFENENIRVVPKLGQATAMKLEELGITQVAHLKDWPESSVDIISGLKIFSLKEILYSADSSFPGSSPYTVIAYRITPNPYESRYGIIWNHMEGSYLQYCVYVAICLRHITSWVHSTRINKGYVWYYSSRQLVFPLWRFITHDRLYNNCVDEG